MLDDYKQEQPIIYQMMKNAVMTQKVSHAYLLDTKNSTIGNEMALAFVKYLLCPSNKTQNNNCENCMQCKKIDDMNYTELKVIDPDGIWIKKEQLDELQEEFSKKALEGQYKIYIIHQVEKLNKSAANSLLKFLEEPEEGIIAILTTDSIYQVLETIRSRCQILSFSKRKSNENSNKTTINLLSEYIHTTLFDLSNEEECQKYLEMIQSIITFIKNFEVKGKETLLYTTKLWHNHISEKENLILAFDIMTFFYNDVLNKKCNREIKIFKDEIEQIHNISEKNTIEQITKKINEIMKMKKNIKINMNNALLIDKLILNMVGGK